MENLEKFLKFLIRLLTCKNKDHDKHNGCITEVENCRSHSFHGELIEVKMNRIDEEIYSSEARCEERSPPPSVIL